MRALQYWKAVTMDRSDFLERLLAVFESLGVEFCVIGGTAPDAYSPPGGTEDLDAANSPRALPRGEKALAGKIDVGRISHNLHDPSAPFPVLFQIHKEP